MRDRIYPINVTIYKAPKSFLTGLVYSEEELGEIVSYVFDKKLFSKDLGLPRYFLV